MKTPDVDDAESEILLKVLTGDTTVGKTTLLSQYLTENPVKNPMPTLGLALAVHKLKLDDGIPARIYLWDTAGQEKYRSIVSAHYRRALGALVVYDITKRATFENATKWVKELKKNADPNDVIMLLGNKLDLVEKDSQLRQVSKEEAANFAQFRKLIFEEVSGYTGENLKLAFKRLIHDAYNEAMINKSVTYLSKSSVETQPSAPSKSCYCC